MQDTQEGADQPGTQAERPQGVRPESQGQQPGEAGPHRPGEAGRRPSEPGERDGQPRDQLDRRPGDTGRGSPTNANVPGTGTRGPVVERRVRGPLGDGTPVHAEGDRAGERPVASWLSPEGSRSGSTREQAVQGLREAASGADRAIEQQAVPPEHADLVRRVFRRYLQRAEQGATGTPGTPKP